MIANFRMSLSRISFLSVLLVTSTVLADGLFDIKAVRDASTLETTVLQDWALAEGNPAVRQKLVEITVCEWWPGQKVRLPVTMNVPADGDACSNVVVANQGLANRAATPTGGQLTLLIEHGVGVVLIGMGTIDAMEPKTILNDGMRQQLLKTRDVQYTPAWIWGMSQMRALTAAVAEEEYFQPEKVLTTGGSKRGVAAAVAGIFDDRFTAILPVVAPILGNPGSPTYVLGTETNAIAQIDDQFYADITAGKRGLKPEAAKALRERAQRRADIRVTLQQTQDAGWTDEDLATIADRVWDACRITDHLPSMQHRGLDVFYIVGTNDSVSPALLELGKRYPDFPVCIIPGGQHGGPSTAGFTRRVPQFPSVKENFVTFARHHFFADRNLPAQPKITGRYSPDKNTLSVTVKFPDGTQPEDNTLWWNIDRSQPYTLPFEYDEWHSAKLLNTGEAKFEVIVPVTDAADRIDFVSLHRHTENLLPITCSSPYQRLILSQSP